MFRTAFYSGFRTIKNSIFCSASHEKNAHENPEKAVLIHIEIKYKKAIFSCDAREI